MKKIFERFLRTLEHNQEHHTKINIKGKTYNFCSRCLGSNTSSLIFFVLFGLMYFFTEISFDFWLVFIGSWFLSGLTIVDWGSAKLGIWKGDNRVRIFTGVTLGMGIMFYFWFLPVNWFFRIFSLIAYEMIFTIIIMSVHMKERGITLDEITKNIEDVLINPKKLFCCGCCSGCCPISGGCCSTILPLLCCLPCCLCPFCGLQGCGKGCGCDKNMDNLCSMGKKK